MTEPPPTENETTLPGNISLSLMTTAGGLVVSFLIVFPFFIFCLVKFLKLKA